LGRFVFLQKFAEIFATLCFIAGFAETGDYALSRIFIDSRTPEINLALETMTPAMIINGNNNTGDILK
jgi:hypothetical protein